MTAEQRLLTPEEEIALARAWQERGCSASLDRLVAAFEPLARFAALDFARLGYPFADAAQEARLALMLAAGRWPTDRGVRFAPYAARWIQCALADWANEWALVRVPRSSLEVAKKRAAAGDESAADTVATASGNLLPLASAVGTGDDEDETDDRPRISRRSEETKAALVDDGGEEQMVARLDGLRRHAKLDEALAALPEREREIIRRHHLKVPPDTLVEIAADLGVTPQAAGKAERVAIAKIARHLRRLGVKSAT